MASTIPPASHLGAASTHICQLAFGSGEIKPPVRRPLDHRVQTRLSGLVKRCVPVGIGPDAGRWLQVTSARRSCSLGAESMYRASHRRSTQHVVFAVLRRCGSSSGSAPRASHASKRHHAAEATAAGLLTLRMLLAVIVSGASGYETAAIYGEAGAGSCADTPPRNAFTIITTTAMRVSVRTLYPFRL